MIADGQTSLAGRISLDVFRHEEARRGVVAHLRRAGIKAGITNGRVRFSRAPGVWRDGTPWHFVTAELIGETA